MKVVVVGAGKMGLPLACQFAANGANVIACDVNPAVVAAINDGRCLIDEPGVPELVSSTVAAGRLCASTNTTASSSQADVIVVIVPAVLTSDRSIDTGALESVADEIAVGMRQGALVSFETTVSVGCTRHVLMPILERRGLKAGRDFGLVFSPERVKSLHVLRNLTVNPKIVGGLDESSLFRGVEFYGTYLGAPVSAMASLEAAELTKLAGMVYRDVNIALSNELARYAEVVGVDINPVIQASNTDGEAQLLSPGIGVGGHCTPVYPYFLTRDARRLGMPATLAERAREINDNQVAHTLDRVERQCGCVRGKQVQILGLGFRPDVKEHICSPAFILREELERRGAEVFLHDPLYAAEELRNFGFRPSAAVGMEILILNTAHSQYRRLDFHEMAKQGVRVALDGRNAWNPVAVRASGITYIGIGVPP